ncbi:MAG: YdcF family protein [Bryobacteraceae bacterium]
MRAGAPQKADIALVLAGDGLGNRVIEAGELVREGYAPKALVSGPWGIYGNYECDLAIPFAEKAGYPASYFLHIHHQGTSTLGEARAVVPELRRLGAHSVLLVTSDYHTRRAGNVFRSVAPDLTFYVVAARDPYFSAHGWWKNREGRKTFLIEWMKTLAESFGL